MSFSPSTVYGQCPKCGGNIATCYRNGCPMDVMEKAKKLSPLQICKARWLIRNLGYDRWAKKQKLNKNHEYLGEC